MYIDFTELIQIDDNIIFQTEKNKLIVYNVHKKEVKTFRVKTESFQHLSHSTVRCLLHYREQGKVNQDVENLFQFHYCCSERCNDHKNKDALNASSPLLSPGGIVSKKQTRTKQKLTLKIMPFKRLMMEKTQKQRGMSIKP